MIHSIEPVTPAQTNGDVVRANYLLTMRIGAAVNELIRRHNIKDGSQFFEHGEGFNPNDATRGQV